jgi:hypothetical protein
VCCQAETYAAHQRPEFTDPDTGAYTPDAETYQGAVMFAARELRRRNSPAGVETYGDGGVSFVSRWDPDIDRALRAGAWQRPGVG